MHNDFVSVIPTNSDKIVLLDLDDWEYLKNYAVYIGYKGYVFYCVENKSERVHRWIMGLPKNKVVDHINRDKLDNRKSNLRICSSADNSRNASIPKTNTSGYKGVQKSSKSNRWEAYITFNGNKIYLGSFVKIEDAAKAREEAEITYYGEFARQEIRGKMGA